MGAHLPVREIPPDVAHPGPAHGIGLCLSGGGYRAMLFHLGPLRRLIEVGIVSVNAYSEELGRLERISSVSGGSLTSGRLGMCWRDIDFDASSPVEQFVELVEKPIRKLSEHTIDVPSVLRGWLPGLTVNGQIIRQYRKYLFGDRQLTDLAETPRFVINAANMQSGALWRFSSSYMADWKVGVIPSGRRTVGIAEAVAASSAFPPVLSPARFRFQPGDYEPNSGGEGANDLSMAPYTTRPVMVDGGVYDNLGLETVWKNFTCVLVSDGGGHLRNQPNVLGGWASQGYRAVEIIGSQVGALRVRSLIESYERGDRRGAYWGIRTNIDNYSAPEKLPCPYENTTRLAQLATRLQKTDTLTQERLINWGYAACDAAIRTHVDPSIPPPASFPYPHAGV